MYFLPFAIFLSFLAFFFHSPSHSTFQYICVGIQLNTWFCFIFCPSWNRCRMHHNVELRSINWMRNIHTQKKRNKKVGERQWSRWKKKWRKRYDNINICGNIQKIYGKWSEIAKNINQNWIFSPVVWCSSVFRERKKMCIIYFWHPFVFTHLPVKGISAPFFFLFSFLLCQENEMRKIYWSNRLR